LTRHGRNTTARITAANVRRIAVAPAAPTTGNNCLASEAPAVSETRDIRRAAYGTQADQPAWRAPDCVEEDIEKREWDGTRHDIIKPGAAAGR
jgi:hypothetical protein